MWRKLAEDDTFWTAVVTVGATLLIAVVVEVRTARERLDHLDVKWRGERLEALRRSDAATREWIAAFDRYQRNEGEHPGEPPQPDSPAPNFDPVAERGLRAEGSRGAALLLAMWALSITVLGSLVAVSPARYPEGAPVDAAMVIVLACAVSGICALLWATTARMLKGS